jgi:hypothetical protein
MDQYIQSGTTHIGLAAQSGLPAFWTLCLPLSHYPTLSLLLFWCPFWYCYNCLRCNSRVRSFSRCVCSLSPARSYLCKRSNFPAAIPASVLGARCSCEGVFCAGVGALALRSASKVLRQGLAASVTEGRCNFGEGAAGFQVGVLAEFSSRILTASVMEDRCESGEGVGSF